MTDLKIGSLFSGYGGLDMAVQSVLGGDIVWYSEIDKHACSVLETLHPGVPNLGDITAIDWATAPPIDILTGGYPCQPFSHAGKRKGTNDERHLWPFVRDAIDALRPRLVVLENVRGHLTLGFGDVLADLSRVGYDARWGVVRAAEAGAPHGRARLFVAAYPSESRLERFSFSSSLVHGTGQIRTSSDGSADFPSYADTGRRFQDVEQSRNLGAEESKGKSSLTHRHSADGPAADALDDGLQHAYQRMGWDGAPPVEGCGGSASDADGTGQQARRDAGRDGKRLRIESVGLASSAPDAGSRSLSRTATAGNGLSITSQRGHFPLRDTEITNGLNDGKAESAIRDGRRSVDWGKYATAIRRWESITRPAPDPTIPGTNGRPRLSPAFVEWMMGLPAGHVTSHGLKPAACLKMLGNGVVPQQAELALRMLVDAR